ncbi:MAG: prolipoprotein diacylglyceryl transferase [Chromatiales bacterium]|nr:MAG: prolipoprotein diacylglyceryl transferase [Chromatiales bacterium]
MWEYSGFDPVAIQLGPLAIRWYGLMYLVGFVGGWWLLRRRALRGRAPVTPAQVDDILFYIALGVILGGRIGYVLFYGWQDLVADPWSLFRIWEGGMSFHGGFLGVLVAVTIFARTHGLRFWTVIDAVAPVVTIGLGAGRLGNFINGELWGRVTDVPWAFIVAGQPRHPSQLYEAFLEGVVLFVVLWTFSAKPRPTMAVSALFLIGYGTFRTLVEFVRLPDEHIGYLAFGWLTMGHVLTIPMILAGCVLMWLAYRNPQTAAPSTT